MNFIIACLILLLFCERMLKHLLVFRFFRQTVPPQINPIQLVSILQPILSGDPTLAIRLEQNLELKSKYPLEFLWLVDDEDAEGQSICRDLIARHPEKKVQMLMLPAPGPRQNPKMIKLIAGAAQVCGDVLCVLDDDTSLPDFGLEECLPHLDLPGVGLAFGLPYYVSFQNFWSQLIAYFVNSHSLINYVPYAMLGEPVTINGMFYAIRREVLTKVGGFSGLETILADDFAVAQRLRAHGYRLAQTPLRHSISTWVDSRGSYLNLIQRWFIFPRESVMRHLKRPEQIRFYTIAMLPVFLPWLALVIPLINHGLWWVTLMYFLYAYSIFAHFNLAYLWQASPWTNSYSVSLISIFLPVQILAALLAPQRIIWRGHIMEAEPGGSFQFIQRRKKKGE